MASLTVTVGNVSASVTGTDANAAALISDYIEASGGPVTGTNEEKLTWWLRAMATSTKLFANEYRRRVLADAAALAAGLNTRDWA